MMTGAALFYDKNGERQIDIRKAIVYFIRQFDKESFGKLILIAYFWIYEKDITLK